MVRLDVWESMREVLGLVGYHVEPITLMGISKPVYVMATSSLWSIL